MQMYAVEVQHPALEHKGETIPNIVYLGTVIAEDAEAALAEAKVAWGDTHAPALLMVTPLN